MKINKPGIALTDSNTSAMCCHLLQKDGERREGGNVIIATAFADRSMLLRDLIKERISQSCNITFVNKSLVRITKMDFNIKR